MSIPVGQELLIANSNANAAGETAKSKENAKAREREMRNKYASMDTNRAFIEGKAEH